jgi:Na+-translocating ferredoxin:NAD+ oxidoreductase RnfE subunit
MAAPDASSPNVRSHMAVAAVQMLLVLLAVAASRLAGSGTGRVAVMVLALANGALVAWSALGLRRQWLPVYVIVAVMLVTSSLLLVWPAWGFIDRVRFH